jgi:hypothetical protein
MDPWFQKRLEGRFLVFRCVWIALMASLGVYGFVLRQMQPGDQADWASILSNPLLVPLSCAACATLALAFVLPPMVMKGASAKAMARPWTEGALRAAVTPKGYPLYREQDIPHLLALPEEDQRLERILLPYGTCKILRWTLSESVAVFGFVLGMTMHSFPVYLPFAAVTLVAMLASGPQLAELKKYGGFPGAR